MAGNADEFVIVKYEDEGEDETDSAPIEPLTVNEFKEGSLLPGNLWVASPTPPTQLRLKLSDSLTDSALLSQSTSTLPSTEAWPGEHHMVYQIDDSGNWKKRGYAYSSILNKLYIDMEKQVALKFFIIGKQPPDSVIRAVPVYVDIGSRSQPVLRCPVHSSLEDPSNTHTPSPILKHLVRSSEASTKYFENQTSGRLSLTTAVKDKAPGCDYFTIFYQFMCLGSCLGGLARRQLQMIFTLETQQGKVLGRQVMEVRICSCPLRDMKQEEQKFSKSIPTTQQSTNRPTPVQIRSKDSFPHVQRTSGQLSLPPEDKEPASQPQQSRYDADDDIFWVPVRGNKNYQAVNQYAEYLDLTSSSACLPVSTTNLRKQRDQLMAAANQHMSAVFNETGLKIGDNKQDLNMKQISQPEPKRRKLSGQYSHLQETQIKVSAVSASQPEAATSLVTRFQPIMPKPTTFNNQPTTFPRNPHSILLQPKGSLAHFHPSTSSLENPPSLSSQLSNARQLQQLRELNALVSRDNVKKADESTNPQHIENKRVEMKVEYSEEEEGEMIIADSLNINNEDSNDGLNELQKKLWCKIKPEEGDSMLTI